MNYKATCLIHGENGDVTVEGYYSDDSRLFVRSDSDIPDWVPPQFNEGDDKESVLSSSIVPYVEYIEMLVSVSIGVVPVKRIEYLRKKQRDAMELHLKILDSIENEGCKAIKVENEQDALKKASLFGVPVTNEQCIEAFAIKEDKE